MGRAGAALLAGAAGALVTAAGVRRTRRVSFAALLGEARGASCRRSGPGLREACLARTASDPSPTNGPAQRARGIAQAVTGDAGRRGHGSQDSGVPGRAASATFQCQCRTGRLDRRSQSRRGGPDNSPVCSCRAPVASHVGYPKFAAAAVVAIAAVDDDDDDEESGSSETPRPQPDGRSPNSRGDRAGSRGRQCSPLPAPRIPPRRPASALRRGWRLGSLPVPAESQRLGGNVTETDGPIMP